MKRIFHIFIVISIMLLVSGVGLTQFSKLKLKLPKKIPGLDKIIKREPALTTNISDAVTEGPFLDDYNPEQFYPMSLLSRNSEGGFILDLPGNYMFEAQSYCLAPGKSSPGGDYGYLYAPLKGPYSDIIRNILKRSYKHPEIPQKRVQMLLWAIISRTKISDMTQDRQITAAKLLTPKEIFRINGGSLGLIPEGLMEKAFDKLPPLTRKIFEAEAQIRKILKEANTTYEELEQAAIAEGPANFEEGSRKIPKGRWSLHPNGFFIRYFPHDYSRMLIQLYVAESFQIERDEKDRIISITDSYGDCIETKYDDDIEPPNIPGEPSLKAYAIRSVSFERFSASELGERLRSKWKNARNSAILKQFETVHPEEKLFSEWENAGWIFTGVATGKGKVNTNSGRFQDLKERYELYIKQKEELIHLNQGLMKMGKSASLQLSQEDLGKILSIGNYATAFKAIMSANTSDKENWAINPVNLIKKAWQAAVCNCMIGHKEQYLFNPAEDPASGNNGEQSGGDSARGTENDDQCSEAFANNLNKAWEDHMKCIVVCDLMHPKDLSCLDSCNLNLKYNLDKANQEYVNCMKGN